MQRRNFGGRPSVAAVRYADGPTVEVEAVIDAPAERVWALVTDVNLPARFSEEFQEGRWLDGVTEAAAGARFQGRNRHQARDAEWETTCTVTACETNKQFAWAVGDPHFPSASWRFELEPAAEGTRLRQWAQLGPAPSGLTPAIEAMPDKEERIVARRLEEHRVNMQATVDGIRALAEADADQPQ
jgi:uncharacterized protein YndB with AHSA1/START domain